MERLNSRYILLTIKENYFTINYILKTADLVFPWFVWISFHFNKNNNIEKKIVLKWELRWPYLLIN